MNIRVSQLQAVTTLAEGDLVAVEKMDGVVPRLRKMTYTDLAGALFGVLTGAGIPIDVTIDGTPVEYTLKIIVVDGGPTLALIPPS